MICLRYQNGRFDAEDCLQNALVKIFSKLSTFDPDKGKFEHWSSRVVTNENLIFLRKRKAFDNLDEAEDRIAAPTHFSDEQALSPKQLTSIIQKLPEGYRTVFNLYVLDGYTHQEIAQILNISVGTSKSQLFKARKMLQQQLEVLL